MRLTSADFSHQGEMPSELTCDGEGRSPQLAWTDPPEGARSFALTCIDPDAPMGEFIHWLIHAIPPSAKMIDGGGPVPEGAMEVANDFGRAAWGGPCPPSGKHRYIFTLYALDVEGLGELSKAEFVEQAEAHAIEKAQLIGLYERH